MVYRVYVEKKKGLENEANSLFRELREMLNITALEKVRLLNRYDVENIEKELFDYSVNTVFSEPQLDNVTYAVPTDDCVIFAVEYLPGQFDQILPLSVFSLYLRRIVRLFVRQEFIASTERLPMLI